MNTPRKQSQSEIMRGDFEELSNTINGRFIKLRRGIRSDFRWFVGISIVLILAGLGYTVTTYAAASTHITRDEVRNEYVSRDDLFILLELNFEKIQEIILLDKVGASDSILIESFKNRKYLNDLIFQINPRGFENSEYDAIIKHIKDERKDENK